jgi:putative alpha-1,2-mannosidase
MVPHDFAGLIDALGGPEATRARLDAHFERINAGTDQPYFTMGNEEEFATPYLYAFARAPWKTQQVLATILDALFTTGPSGLPGNDDLGAMSSWFFWSTIGLYPAVPGVAGFVIAAPRLPEVRLLLPDGAIVTITAPAAGPDGRYVHRLRVDGTTRSRPWVSLEELARGAHLEFDLAAEPDESWGAAEEDVPPSFLD